MMLSAKFIPALGAAVAALAALFAAHLLRLENSYWVALL